MTANGEGRRAHSPYERGLTVRLPAVLINSVDDYANDEFYELRSHAVRDLLERGLASVSRPLIRPRRSKSK